MPVPPQSGTPSHTPSSCGNSSPSVKASARPRSRGWFWALTVRPVPLPRPQDPLVQRPPSGHRWAGGGQGLIPGHCVPSDRREYFRDWGHRPQTGGWRLPAAGPHRASPGPELHRGAWEVVGAPPLTPGLPFRAQTCPHLLCCPFPDLCPHGQRAKKWGLGYTGT